MTRRSLTSRLSVLLVLATVVLAGLAGVLSYERSLNEARDLQDDVLLQVAALASSTRGATLDTDRDPIKDSASDIDVSPLSTSGLSSDPGRRPKTVVMDGRELRVVAVGRRDAEPVVVSQAVTVRDEIARSAALAAVLPLALLLPVLLALIVLGVRRVLAPVDHLANEVEHRDADDLTPLAPARVPAEIGGFVAAFDRLLGRVREAQEHERRFVAQAAHELRTPLTAMSLQLERAATAEDPETVRDRLSDIRSGVERSRHLVDQLLDLARAQSADPGGQPPRTDRFDAVLRAALSEVLHLAYEREVSLEVPKGGDDRTPVPAAELGASLRNVLDNAIRYGPRGAAVTLRAERIHEGLVITVEDEGPGLRDPKSAVRPFVREASQSIEGSGLGLAIAAELLRRAGGDLAFSGRSDRRPGLRVVLSVPILKE